MTRYKTATTPTPAGSPTSTATAGATATAASQTKTIGASPRTLTAAAYIQQTPPTTFTFNTYPPVAKFGNPDPLNVELNSGSLTEGIKLDVPPGPAGAMPNLTLAFNSAAVSEQHSPQGASGWVGEGWNLSLGSISWAEHNVVPTCATNCTNSWQSQWMLTDPFGTSKEFIPPNLATSTYYDDSVAGQFVSADTVTDGLNRYGYVAGNPTTATDPTGHRMVSQDEYGRGTCDFSVDNVTVVHEECANPELGCSYANATRAVVGPGKLQQKGTDNTPTVYSYGSKQNGVLLTGFKGKSLDNFIKAMEDLRDLWQRFLDADSQYGSLAIDIASLIGAFATQVGQCLATEFESCPLGDGDMLQQLKDEYNANLTGIEQLAVTVAQESVDDYNHSIAALKGVASKGQTVWYMQMMWLGHNASRYSQVLGGISFFTGWGDQPPPDALLAIGESMRAQCAGFNIRWTLYLTANPELSG